MGESSPILKGDIMSADTKLDERVTVAIQPPKMWKVIFLNDDKTPMEFVIELLTTIFKHSSDSAKNLTLEIHNEGAAVVGTFTHEIAEQKGLEATQSARNSGFPLKVTIEQESQ
jgi:ATP-dependent Clp protease adaptor protein ClpS